MINWIIGGIIIGLTLYTVARIAINIRKGKTDCCSGCSGGKCGCETKNT